MRILIAGIAGKMGKEVYKMLYHDHQIEGFDLNDYKKVKIYKNISDLIPSKYDLLIDFTSSMIAPKLIDLFIENNINVISGTTGINNDELNYLKEKALLKKVSFYHSVNFASGFSLFKDAVKSFKVNLPLVEIVESHNVTKLDIPSGSAKVLADILNVDYKDVKALRNHENEPMHTVIFSNPNEKVLVMHQILNRKAFIDGFMEVFLKFSR